MKPNKLDKLKKEFEKRYTEEVAQTFTRYGLENNIPERTARAWRPVSTLGWWEDNIKYGPEGVWNWIVKNFKPR